MLNQSFKSLIPGDIPVSSQVDEAIADLSLTNSLVTMSIIYLEN